MKIQSFIRKFSTIIGLISLTSLIQAAEFHLPNRIPGFAGQTRAPFAGNNPRDYEKVTVPGTTCDLFFPIDGFQPKTSLAGRYSGARFVGQLGDDLVTDWWVRVFGGNRAVRFSRNPNQLKEPKMGFGDTNNPVHIIHVDTTGAGRGFSQEFWQVFRQIAADPVGRVLLYRLLIEIRRLDRPEGDGCCEDGVNVNDLEDRNDCRNLKIVYSNNGLSFNTDGLIRFDPDPNIETTILAFVNNRLTTPKKERTADIGLFHEMLHWFHFLRYPDRYDNSSSSEPQVFKYPLRCYYGDVSRLCTWGSEIDSDEIAVILGTPNLNAKPHPYTALGRDIIVQNAFYPDPIYNHIEYDKVIIHNLEQYIPRSDKFLNGDDLSENVYRLSKSQKGFQFHQYMRFGHGDCINPNAINTIPDEFLLAYRVARDCYVQITGRQPQNWDLAQGQAIK